jgi:hypothetical protein
LGAAYTQYFPLPILCYFMQCKVDASQFYIISCKAKLSKVVVFIVSHIDWVFIGGLNFPPARFMVAAASNCQSHLESVHQVPITAGARGNVDSKACPRLSHMASHGDRTRDLCSLVHHLNHSATHSTQLTVNKIYPLRFTKWDGDVYFIFISTISSWVFLNRTINY